MFERFTTTARAVVTTAAETAIADAAPELGTGRLLLGLCNDSGPAGRALSGCGVTAKSVRAQLDAGVESALDDEALAGIGIDLEDVRRRVEEAFGPGALDRAGRRPRKRRRTAGGAARFSPGSVRMLERAVRAAARSGAHELRSEHLLGGLLDGPDPQTDRILAGCGTDAGAVRTALADETRRSA